MQTISPFGDPSIFYARPIIWSGEYLWRAPAARPITRDNAERKNTAKVQENAVLATDPFAWIKPFETCRGCKKRVARNVVHIKCYRCTRCFVPHQGHIGYCKPCQIGYQQRKRVAAQLAQLGLAGKPQKPLPFAQNANSAFASGLPQFSRYRIPHGFHDDWTMKFGRLRVSKARV